MAKGSGKIRNRFRRIFRNKEGGFRGSRFWNNSRNKFREFKSNYSDWYQNNKDRFKTYARNTAITGVMASVLASGIFFTKYFENKDHIIDLTRQKNNYTQMMDEARVQGFDSTKNDISDVINRIKRQRENLDKPSSTYTVEKGDNLSQIAMELTGNKDLSWAEKLIQGEQLTDAEQETFKTYLKLAKKADKENLFTKENLRKFGPTKGYPTAGPNLLDEEHGGINLEGTPPYEKKFDSYKEKVSMYDSLLNKLNGIKDSYTKMQDSAKSAYDNLKQKKSNIEDKLNDMKDNWENLGWGALFAVPPLAFIGNYFRKKRKKKKGKTKGNGNNGGNNSGYSGGNDGGNSKGRGGYDHGPNSEGFKETFGTTDAKGYRSKEKGREGRRRTKRNTWDGFAGVYKEKDPNAVYIDMEKGPDGVYRHPNDNARYKKERSYATNAYDDNVFNSKASKTDFSKAGTQSTKAYDGSGDLEDRVNGSERAETSAKYTQHENQKTGEEKTRASKASTVAFGPASGEDKQNTEETGKYDNARQYGSKTTQAGQANDAIELGDNMQKPGEIIALEPAEYKESQHESTDAIHLGPAGESLDDVIAIEPTDALRDTEPRKNSYTQNLRYGSSTKNPYKAMDPYNSDANKKTADKRLGIYQDFDWICAEEMEKEARGELYEGREQSLTRAMEKITEKYDISKTTVYNYVNWVDSHLLKDRENMCEEEAQTRDYILESLKNMSNPMGCDNKKLIYNASVPANISRATGYDDETVKKAMIGYTRPAVNRAGQPEMR